MKAQGSVRLWLLLALLLSVTLGFHQLGRQGMMGSGLYSGASLKGQALVLHDAGGRLPVEAVAQAYREGRFVHAAPADLVFGYTRDAIWLSTEIANPGPDAVERYLEVGPPRLEDVRVYLPAADGHFREVRSGIRVPLLDRAIPSRQLVVPLALAPGERQRVYVRLASRNSMLVEIRLWEPTRFLEAARHMDLLNGLQFGALLLFALYAFATAVAMRERAYFYFGITLLCYAAYDISILQYGYQYLWPSSPDWSLRSPGVVLALSAFGMGMLVTTLLEARTRFPRWSRVLRGLALAGLLLMLPLSLGDYRAWVQILNYVALLQLLATIGVTLQAVFLGTRGAALLLGAFLLLWFTSLLRVGQILGWLPPNILAEYSQGWSMVVGGLLMAMTQADRVRRLDAQREQAQRALVDSQVSAREQAERAVAERTRELVQARDAAEASSRAKSAFLAQLSHELRTPLHSILGYSGLLRADATDAESQRRLEAIRRSGTHLLGLIDGLLDYARGEAGRLQLELQPLRLRQFLESVADETRALAAEQGMVLETDFADSLPPSLRLDGMRLRQILINLIANACRHSQGRRILLSAEGLPAVREGRARIRIAVADDGVGIPDADRERIFQPFEQGSEATANKGMGLGLAIVRQLVTLMDAEIELAPGAPGSRFLITLDAEAVELPAPQAPASGPGPEPGWQPPAGTPAAPRAPLCRPSPVLLEELREAALQGRISDIEDWVEHVREAEPGAAEFAGEVLLAVRRLDLAGIVAMTR